MSFPIDLFDGRDYMASNNEDNEIDLETINSEIPLSPPSSYIPQAKALAPQDVLKSTVKISHYFIKKWTHFEKWCKK
jgi:hypothetical protein